MTLVSISTFGQFSVQGNEAYHRECYKELFHPKCEVCSNFVSAAHKWYNFAEFLNKRSLLSDAPSSQVCQFLFGRIVGCNFAWAHSLVIGQIPTNAAGLIEYRSHPFWNQKYCPRHERDDTPRCCSCDRIEVRLRLFQ